MQVTAVPLAEQEGMFSNNELLLNKLSGVPRHRQALIQNQPLVSSASNSLHQVDKFMGAKAECE